MDRSIEDDPIIYAQIQREPNRESKLERFLQTIPRFRSKSTQSSHRQRNVRIGFNLDSRSSNKLPSWFQVDSERRCLSIKEQQSSIRMIPYDYLFLGSLPEKLRSIPATLLTEPIESLADGRLHNAVIIAIDDPINMSLTNEFRQFVHRGLMMHSIAWLFDAIHNGIENEKCLNQSNHNRAFIQLSASVLFPHKIYDLIGNDHHSSQSALVAVDQEIEYECLNARQAANHLERALGLLQQIHSANNLHLFVLTIHLYRFQMVANTASANSSKKCPGR
ncbi:hypothetical protein BLA29_002544 [Euroglyphus maynei]|uniref:Uncharacterized protein n=1 Tax=Euroglyphus maynei TaxID=6958 RepID=A0A1Y3BDP6_EURMA|nr:hypothetical protein BLA29_002544 [Euroglyphus maynei]